MNIIQFLQEARENTEITRAVRVADNEWNLNEDRLFVDALNELIEETNAIQNL